MATGTVGKMATGTVRKCCICKKLSEDVDFRQGDDLKCKDCHLRSVKPYQGKGQEENLATNLNTSGQSDGELKATSFLFDHLLDNLVIKEKVSKGIKKSSFKWTGTTEPLKDFVALVLKKIGTWYKPERKSISFKTANLTLVFYENQSLRFHGKDTDKTKDRLASLKNMQLLPLPRQDTHSFTLGPLTSVANTTPSNNVTGSVMFADRPTGKKFSELESADTDSFYLIIQRILRTLEAL